MKCTLALVALMAAMVLAHRGGGHGDGLGRINRGATDCQCQGENTRYSFHMKEHIICSALHNVRTGDSSAATEYFQHQCSVQRVRLRDFHHITLSLFDRCLSGVDPRIGQVMQCKDQFHQSKRACHTLALQTAISSGTFGSGYFATTDNGTVLCSCGPQAPRNNTGGGGNDVKRQIRDAIQQVIPRATFRQAKQQCRSQCRVPFLIILSCSNQVHCSAIVNETRHYATASPRAHNSRTSENDSQLHFQSHLLLQLPSDQYLRWWRSVPQRSRGTAGAAELPRRRWRQRQH